MLCWADQVELQAHCSKLPTNHNSLNLQAHCRRGLWDKTRQSFQSWGNRLWDPNPWLKPEIVNGNVEPSPNCTMQLPIDQVESAPSQRQRAHRCRARGWWVGKSKCFQLSQALSQNGSEENIYKYKRKERKAIPHPGRKAVIPFLETNHIQYGRGVRNHSFARSRDTTLQFQNIAQLDLSSIGRRGNRNECLEKHKVQKTFLIFVRTFSSPS